MASWRPAGRKESPGSSVGTITDSHFFARNRFGRTVVFLTRILNDRLIPGARTVFALGVDEGSSVVVDPDGIIRFAYVTDMSVGRNPQEVLRVLDALQTDELCPCNWQKGQPTLGA